MKIELLSRVGEFIVIYFDEVETPIGTLFLASDGEKIIRIEYGTKSHFEKHRLGWLIQYFHGFSFVQASSPFGVVRKELDEYFRRERDVFTFSFHLVGTDFQKKVWRTLFDNIQFGETKSYKDIAEIIGKPKAVRAVGGAVNKNPLSIVVPCHRVIGANGKMVGYNGGLDKKAYLLNHESINL